MSDINKEIEEMAEKLEKSTITPKESLLKTIKELGPEGIRAKLPTLAKSEQVLLKEVLEDMAKAKAPEMDADYADKYHKGKVKDSIIEEDTADDDQDEKLVKDKNKKMKNQGDNSPEGIEGQIIKSITDDEFETLTKSFGEDFDVIDDFIYSESDEFVEELLEKGAATVTRGGIRYYSSGVNAGKKVGTIRGDKASINSIARARKRGKISDAGVKAGLADVKVSHTYEKARDKNGRGASSKSFEAIRGDAMAKLANSKVGMESKQFKERAEAHRQRQERKNAPREKAESKLQNAVEKNKDGTVKLNRKNGSIRTRLKKLAEKKDVAEDAGFKDYADNVREPAYRAVGDKIKDLKAKREAMNKAEELEKGRGPDLTPRKKKGQGGSILPISKRTADGPATPAHAQVNEYRQHKAKQEGGSVMATPKLRSKLGAKLAEQYKANNGGSAAIKTDDKKKKKEGIASRVKGFFSKSEDLDSLTNLDLVEAVATCLSEDISDVAELKKSVKEVVLDLLTKSEELKATKLPEESQVEDKLDDLQKEKVRGDKKRPKELEVEKDAQKIAEPMKKGIEWGSEDALLKSDRGGRNHSFSVNGYYDELLTKSEEVVVEKLVKSEKEDINDLIEKGGDTTSGDILAKSIIEKSTEKVNGALIKSFADDDIAQALGLTEEEAKKLLGE